MKPTSFFCAVAIACVAHSSPAIAQGRSELSLDAHLGLIHRGGNVYASENGVVLEGLGTLRLGGSVRGSVVAALAGGFDVFASNDACVLTASGGCRSGASFGHGSALLGWQTHNAIAVRALGGVGYYGEDTGNAGAAGIEGRLDVAMPLLPLLAFTVSTRAALLPNARGEAVSMFAATLGLRLR